MDLNIHNITLSFFIIAIVLTLIGFFFLILFAIIEIKENISQEKIIRKKRLFEKFVLFFFSGIAIAFVNGVILIVFYVS